MGKKEKLEKNRFFYIIDTYVGIITVILMVILGIYFPVGWTLQKNRKGRKKRVV
ncbi:MAG: hypothetical protein ACFE9C_08435 [Candidatus Hodarchaeota archaeon]